LGQADRQAGRQKRQGECIVLLKVDNGLRTRMLKVSNDVSWDNNYRYGIIVGSWEICEVADYGETWHPTDEDAELMFRIPEIIETDHIRENVTVDPSSADINVDPFDADMILMHSFRDGRKLYLFPNTAYLMDDNGKTIERI
jgi:hypothetical protein